MRPDGFVLAGGRSRRMGFDKARAPWEGVPLAIAVLEGLRDVCDRVAIIRRGASDGLPWIGRDGVAVEVLRERNVGEPHPLHGVVTALSSARGEVALVVPCDVPGLTTVSLRALVDAAPAVATDGRRRHPLVGAFPVSWRERAAELAAAGATAHAFAEAAAEVLIPSEELANLNDPGALGPGRVATLLAGLPFLDPDEAATVARGERGRLAARGILDVPWPGDVEGS